MGYGETGPQPPKLAEGRSDEDFSLACRNLGDGRALYVYMLTYGRARLGIGQADLAVGFDDVW
jgi:hypothetical protein